MHRSTSASTATTIKAEYSHYCAFADLYDELRPAGAPKLNPQVLEPWPEEDALTALRYRHQDEHGALGMRACKFTEGGYCTLFSAGMALKGRPGVDGPRPVRRAQARALRRPQLGRVREL